MSFIGNVPAEAYSPVAKDTFSGNDSTTDFTLSIPATTNSVEVFVENVQQEPTTAYTISGTTLSFTAAPVTGTNNIYVIHRGPAVQQIVPPAGVALNPSTVDATGDISTEGDLKVEVTSGGIYTITGTDTATNRTLTLPDEAGTVLTSGGRPISNVLNNLYFYSITTGTQGISTDPTVILWPETYDPNSLYNAVNGRFTVDSGTAGTYLILADITAYSLQSPGGVSYLETKVRKNESDVSVRLIEEETNADETTAGNAHVVAISLSDGDYIDVTGYINGTSGAENVLAGSSLTIVKLI